MSDHNDGLLLPTRKVISLEDAKRVQPPGKAPGDVLSERTKAAMGELSLHMGQQIYDQLAGETQVFLQDMELALMEGIRREVRNEMTRRSVRGRFRALLIRLGAREKGPELVADAPPVDDKEAKMRAAEDEALHTHAP